MNRFWWWCAERVSRLLDRAEREAVYGDFAESGQTGGRAFRDLLGLVARRQAACWRNDWRPWAVMVGLIIPFGVLLSLESRSVAGWSSTYLWLYLNNWRMDDLGDTGFWVLLAQSTVALASAYALLVCSSWSVGLALGSWSRRTIPVSAAWFTLAFLLAAWLAGFSRNPALRLDRQPVLFYGWFYPLLVLVVMALLPGFWGMRHGGQLASRARLLRSSLFTAAAATLVLLAVRTLAMLPIHSAFLAQMAYSEHSLAVRLQPIAFWPVIYWAATRWRTRLRRG